MTRLRCSRPSWGAVRDPESGEHVSLDADVDREVAERLADRYDPVEIAESDGVSGTCTETMTSGEVCGRDRPCQYHDD